MFVLLIFSLSIVYIFMDSLKESYSLPVSEEKDELISFMYYKEDVSLMKEDMFKFIDKIDDSLIPNISFFDENKLSDNYDFLTEFAIDFIMKNSKYYSNDIVSGDTYQYIDSYNNTFSTNKYISRDVIYDITNKVLGREYYYITNEYLKNDELVPLLKLNENNFFMNISEIKSIDVFSGYVNVLVKYDELDYLYKYIFEKKDNILVISNLTIEV